MRTASQRYALRKRYNFSNSKISTCINSKCKERERADDGDDDSAQSQSFKRTRLGSTANVIGVEAIIRATTTRKTAAWQGDDAIV